MREADTVPSGFVLNVHKEIPWTSHDAVGRIRRILGIRQVGHAGSLDPFATGVLVVAVGKATKLVPHLMDLTKEYRGTLLFGRRTASGDAGGAITGEGPVPEAGRERLEEVARGFLGPGLQVPPMVSAVKHDGRRLYDLARKGIEVERAPRPIVIHRFEIRAVEAPRVDFELECGRGTYVRTLVEDFAARLGTVAFVEALVRTRIGRFSDADACRINSPPFSDRNGLLARAVPMGEAIAHLPGARVDGRWVRRLRQGMVPPWKWLETEETPPTDGVLRLLGPEGELIALARTELMPGPADRPLRDSLALRLERVF